MEAMAQVWPAAISPAPRKLVALVLADECRNAEGTGIFPSLKRIAIKAGMSEDQARRHLQALATSGVIEVERRHRQHYTTSYRLRFEVLQTLHVCDLSDISEVASVQFRGRTHAAQTLHVCGSEVAPVLPEPSEPSEPGGAHRGVRSRPAADAAAPGTQAKWEKLERIRGAALIPRWRAAARELHLGDDAGADEAIELLIAHTHWKDFPGPGRSPGRASRGSVGQQYDYTLRF